MEELGFTKAKPACTGRPAYNPSDMVKLYIYGYFYKIRSSRKLQQECGRNLELFWLLGKLRPDFRTIADFRKDNPKALKQVFMAFVKLCIALGLYRREFIAVDGSKFRAQNSDDNCYNQEVLEKKLRHIEEKLATYLTSLDLNDQSESEETLSAEQINAAILDLKTRQNHYQSYLQTLKDSGESQILLTDPEARRMHTKDGFHCCYNVQTAVDIGSHLIAAYEVTNHNTDQGLLQSVCEQTKEQLEVKTIEVVADKGYESRKDILHCLFSGSLPQVALKYDKKERIFNLPYQEVKITATLLKSLEPEDIKTCLHAGILPDCYKDKGLTAEIQEPCALSCFLKQANNTVICPTGNTLSPTKKKGNNTIYASKDACRQCTNRCTSSSQLKTVSFGPNSNCIPVRMYASTQTALQPIPQNAQVSPNNHTLDREDYIAQKKVVLRIREDKQKLKERMCHVEHPFGTVKWYGGAHYLLCRGKEKATAEIGLSFLCYNLRRVINELGVKGILEAL